ncbi:MAG: methyltransferase domain-containing protein [Planctomycetota bacterium]
MQTRSQPDLATDARRAADWVACPDCGGEVTPDHDNGLACTGCGLAVPVRHGIAGFADPSFYWGEIDREAMEALLDDLERDGDVAAAVDRAETNRATRRFHRNVLDVNRSDWRYLVPGLTEANVLDIGAGMGANTFGLATVARHVVALEGVMLRCRFLESRRRIEGWNNVTVVHGDSNRLPLAHGRFDLAVVNGMLEWVAMRDNGVDPRLVQRQFLEQVHDRLAPGGRLYVGIENRIGLASFTGAIDHSGYPYTMLMPRRVADWYVRRKADRDKWRSDDNNQGYRTYTYGMGGYRRLLWAAGFTDVEFYWVDPVYNSPRCWVPLASKRAMLEYLACDGTRRSWKGRLVRTALRLMVRCGIRGVAPSNFIILAKKGLA